MADWLVAAALNEGTWLPLSMLTSFLAAALVLRGHPSGERSDRAAVLASMNAFYGCMILVMGCGHLLAITIKLSQGTLPGSPWLLYPIGIALVVPSGLLLHHAARRATTEVRGQRRTMGLNVWLGVTLLALGPTNVPLVAPAALNLAYALHGRRAVGWTIVTVAVALNLALFAGSLVFLASGKTFEEFSAG